MQESKSKWKNLDRQTFKNLLSVLSLNERESETVRKMLERIQNKQNPNQSSPKSSSQQKITDFTISESNSCN